MEGVQGRGPVVVTFFDEATFTASHIVADAETGCCAIIDSVLDFDPKSGRTSRRSADALIEHVRRQAWRVDWILETHAHADHMSAAPYLKQVLGGRIAMGRHITAVQATFKQVFNLGPEFAADGSQFDHLFDDEEPIQVGRLRGRALHTPGHTPACVTYVFADAAFVGDTLFMPDFGTARTDFPGGDARTLYRSIQRVLSLPLETRLYLCHDYQAPGRNTFAWQTTVEAERRGNIHVNDALDEVAFVRLREARDATLDLPALLLPAIQVNIRGGQLPPPESNGVRYLKLPIDAL